MTEAMSADWIANLKNTLFVVSSLCGLMFGIAGAIAKLCDENLQIWTWTAKRRQRELWRARARFRALFRRLYYSQFHDLFYHAIEDAKSFLLQGLLKPDDVFSQVDRTNESKAFHFILLPIAIVFTWAYYILLQALLTTPELVIPPSFKELAAGTAPLVQWNEQDGAWTGLLLTLIGLPLFTFLPIAFSIFWGLGVVSMWHRLIANLPTSATRYYAPLSGIPRVIVISFGLTALALVVGKYTNPSAPIPHSPRLFAINTVFDALSVIAAWVLLRNAPWLGIKEKPLIRFLSALLRLSGATIVTAACAVLSLYLSLVGTINALPLPVVLNTFFARPSPPVLTFSLPAAKDSHQTLADQLIEKNEKGADDKVQQNVLVAYFYASETGSNRLFDRVEQIDGGRFSKEFREQFNAFKQAAAIQYYGRSGYGPYFWLMHTTMFPMLVVLAILLVYAATFFLRIVTAAWTRRASTAEKPYNYVAVCCGLCAAFCTTIAYLTK